VNIEDLFQLGMDRLIIPASPLAQEGDVCLNLGAGNKVIPRAIALDLPEWDADSMKIPHISSSVDHIYAFHFLEHVADPVGVLRECQRVLKPGGTIHIVVPYYTSQMQAHDLYHKHVFCEETWRNLFSTPYYERGFSWQLEIGLNIIIGIVERNLCLMTQLHKV